MEVVSFVLASSVYMASMFTKDLPFNYITQKEGICKLMGGNFCSRVSFAAVTTFFYSLYTLVTDYLSLPVRNALNDSPSTYRSGAALGLFLAATSIFMNILGGFIEVKGVDWSKVWLLPSIIVGMHLTGLTEELLYRALPINALRSYMSEDVLVVLTALIFGYVHSEQSLAYGLTTTISGVLFGYGFLRYGLYWAIGAHSNFNILETFFYTVAKVSVKNSLMTGERTTPDDDGLTGGLVELAALFALKRIGYL